MRFLEEYEPFLKNLRSDERFKSLMEKARRVSESLTQYTRVRQSILAHLMPPRLDDDNTYLYSVIMIRTQVSLDEQMYKEALEEAKRQRISFAEFCRRALAHALRHRGEKLSFMRFAGIIEDAGRDASQSVDDVVYGREKP